jgi:hypothetical protein
MARRIPTERWSAIAVRRRWGWFLYACFFGLFVAVALAALFWIVRPRPAVHPLHLIGSDVDGLVVIELSGASPRVERFLQTLIRPLSYEVQSRPEELEQEASHLLDVMTFRRAIGLLRYDPVANREQWALVVALKRMGDPLKVLVKQIAGRQGTAKIEMETSGGVLRFWGKPEMPCFAIERRAFIVAGDRQWLDEIIARIENPLKKTPQAKQLYYGLPNGGRHCIARACVFVPRPRWDHWVSPNTGRHPLLDPIGRVRRLLGECGLEPAAVKSLSVAATVQPRGHLQFDLRISCADTSTALALSRRMSRNWSPLSKLLRGPNVADVVEPTTTSAGVAFGWTTPRLEEMLGLSAGESPEARPRQ